MTPTKSEILANHERYAERKALYKRFGYEVEEESAFIIEKAHPSSGNILEAGTGKGHFSLTLAQEGFKFTSFDISEAEQKYALLNLLYYGLEQQICFDIANAESLTYENGIFDIIFAVNVIHHLPRAFKVCYELSRVLSPSGKIVISDFNVHGLAIMDKIHSLDGSEHEVGPDTLADVKKMLMEREFEVEQHSGVNQDTLIAYREHS
jgi:2-polyprenyl-3-methyl-5-hydroxy-6-metoxy-1,4-benzoquinol methylase